MDNYNIIIIDDDVVDLKALEKTVVEVIEKHDVKSVDVTTYTSSVRAINAIETVINVPLIIADVHLPDRDAVDILNHMAEQKSPIPVLLVTGADIGNMRIANVIGSQRGVHVIGACEKPLTVEVLERVFAQLELIDLG